MNPRPLLECSALSFRYDGPRVLDDVGFSVAPGEVVGLVGPNGSGKSTLLRVLAGLASPASGAVLVDGAALASLSRPQIARRIGFVPQDFELAFPFSALEVVLTGRHAHLPWPGLERAEDLTIARRAMGDVGVDHLEDRSFHTLSGGERQRTVIAAALAQQPRLLLLDEPTSNLDLHYQEQVLAVVHELAASAGISALLVVHDLNVAMAWCPRVLLLSDGKLLADASPAEVLTEARLDQVYGSGARVVRHEGRIAILPAGPGVPSGGERG